MDALAREGGLVTRRHILAGVLGLSLLIGVGIAPSTQQTEAAWVDPEYASVTVTAYNVPEPVTVLPGCVTSSGLLGADPVITIYWRIPSGVTGYTVANAQFASFEGSLLGSLLTPALGSLETTGSPSAYVTVVKGGLLTGLLGGAKSFAIRLVGPAGWHSDWIVANSSLGLLGANPQCSMTTAPSV